MSSSMPKRRILRIAGISLLVLLVIASGIGFYLSQHYKSIIRAKLPVVAAKATDSLYRLTADDYSINVITQTVSVINLRLRPDTAVVARRRREGRGPHVLLDVIVPELEVSGLKWGDMVTDKEAVCEEVGIYHPKINITITADSARHDPARKQPGIERLLARNIRIEDPQITFTQGAGDKAFRVSAKGGSIRATDWDFHPRERSAPSRFFYAKTADVRLEQLAWRKPGSLYAFGLDTVHFLSEQHSVVMAGAYLRPTVTKAGFYSAVGKQKEIYEGRFPLVRINDFNWEDFITHQSVAAGSMDIAQASLDIYLSRIPKQNLRSKVGNYPHQMLRKLQVPIHIPIIRLYKGAFRYTELNDKTKMAGSLDFSNIHGQITNVTNLPEKITADPHCYIKLCGKFMRKSDMGVTFDFYLPSRNGAFSVKGKLVDLEGSQVSETAKALALAEIKSLHVHRFDFSISGNDTFAKGTSTIRYNDLKIKLQKVVNDSRRLKGRGFLSLLANELIIYNDNPMEGEDLRMANTYVSRDTTKSFFNLIWRNMFNGFLQTAIRQEGISDLVKQRQAKKGKEKVHFFRKLFPKKKKKDEKK